MLSKWSVPLPEVDILSYVFDESRPESEKPLFQDAENSNDCITKGQLRAMVRKLGYGIKLKHAIKDTDVILACMSNSTRFPLAFLATLCAGGVFSAVNPTYKPAELLWALQIAECKIIFTDLAALPLVEETLKSFEGHKPVIYIMEYESKLGKISGYKTHLDLMGNGEMDWQPIRGSEATSKRMAVLAFSSGTSGRPKGCCLSHRNFVACAEGMHFIETMQMNEEQKQRYGAENSFLSYLPMYHASGMILGCFNNIRTGATTYILSKYTMPKLLRAVQEYRITYLVMVPAVVASLIKSDVDVNRFLPSVRKVLCVASYLGKEAAQELRNLFSSLPSPPILQQNWGMTEVTGAGTVLPPSEETDGLNIGYLAPNLEARLLDDKGQLVEEGQHGELVVRGPTVFMGYWKDPKATEEGRTADGWHRTGDVMTVDRNGMWTFKGRDKHIIKVKGFQVSLAEIESVLMSCEHVQDCAVIKVMRNGLEAPQAHIIPKTQYVTKESILEFMDGALSAYKTLSGGIHFVDSIPKSQSGKPLHSQIKDPFEVTGLPKPRL